MARLMPGGSCAGIDELPEAARGILEAARRAFLSTVAADGQPHTVPVCFALRDGAVVTAVDHKPKRGGELARITNIKGHPQAALAVDRWDEDWRRLGWVMLQGEAAVEGPGSADAELAARYPQYRDRPPEGVVISLQPKRIIYWTWTP